MRHASKSSEAIPVPAVPDQYKDQVATEPETPSKMRSFRRKSTKSKKGKAPAEDAAASPVAGGAAASPAAELAASPAAPDVSVVDTSASIGAAPAAAEPVAAAPVAAAPVAAPTEPVALAGEARGEGQIKAAPALKLEDMLAGVPVAGQAAAGQPGMAEAGPAGSQLRPSSSVQSFRSSGSGAFEDAEDGRHSVEGTVESMATTMPMHDALESLSDEEASSRPVSRQQSVYKKDFTQALETVPDLSLIHI